MKVKYLCRDKTAANGNLPLPDSRSGGTASFSAWILLRLKCFMFQLEIIKLVITSYFASALTRFRPKGSSARTPLLQGDFCIDKALLKHMMTVKNYPSTHLLISLGPVLTVVVATNEPGHSLVFQIHLWFHEFSNYCEMHLSNFFPLTAFISR